LIQRKIKPSYASQAPLQLASAQPPRESIYLIIFRIKNRALPTSICTPRGKGSAEELEHSVDQPEVGSQCPLLRVCWVSSSICHSLSGKLRRGGGGRHIDASRRAEKPDSRLRTLPDAATPMKFHNGARIIMTREDKENGASGEREIDWSYTVGHARVRGSLKGWACPAGIEYDQGGGSKPLWRYDFRGS
jgi:hypothetical protein